MLIILALFWVGHCKSDSFRFVGFGRCFRAESGGYGQTTRGLYRVHQFSKVELFAFTANETGEESEEVLREMVDMQEEIAQELGFHYRSGGVARMTCRSDGVAGMTCRSGGVAGMTYRSDGVARMPYRSDGVARMTYRSDGVATNIS